MFCARMDSVLCPVSATDDPIPCSQKEDLEGQRIDTEMVMEETRNESAKPVASGRAGKKPRSPNGAGVSIDFPLLISNL